MSRKKLLKKYAVYWTTQNRKSAQSGTTCHPLGRHCCCLRSISETNLLDRLLNSATADNLRAASISFKRENFSKGKGSYTASRGLNFEPAEASGGRHGQSDSYEDPAIALSRAYRLGCQYPDDFHYDLTRSGAGNKLKDVELYCRQKGAFKPDGERENLLVDDCFR